MCVSISVVIIVVIILVVIMVVLRGVCFVYMLCTVVCPPHYRSPLTSLGIVSRIVFWFPHQRFDIPLG